MIFTPSGSFYSKVQFKTEEEVEKVVVDNFKLLFGDYSILLPKSKILTSGGKGTIPDGIIVDFKESRWFILEVERGIHETWGHIAPQINKQLVAVMNPDTKNKIIDLCISEISKQNDFAKLIETDLKIQLLKVHGFVQGILAKDPIVSLPIDYSPSDLEEWAKSLKVEVQIQHIEKYINSNGDVLYDFPDLELAQENESLNTSSKKNNALSEIVKAGLLNVGEAVYFDYSPKGGKAKTRFEGKICADGIDAGGVVSSPSISALLCVKTVKPTRTSENGWVKWKTKDGKLLEEKWKAYLKLKGDDSFTIKDKGKKKNGKKISKKSKNDAEVMLYHYAKSGELIATMKIDGSSYIVCKGSKLSLKNDIQNPGWIKVREKASINTERILLEDIVCSSSSMAAAIVAGGQRSGNVYWKKSKNNKRLTKKFC